MPDPILVDIAAALATKSATSLYDLVKSKLTSGGRESDALEAADVDAPDSITYLAEELERAEAEDPDFATALRAEWNATQIHRVVDHDSVSNEITGTVKGNVVQARDVQGNISFGS